MHNFCTTTMVAMKMKMEHFLFQSNDCMIGFLFCYKTYYTNTGKHMYQGRKNMFLL